MQVCEVERVKDRVIVRVYEPLVSEAAHSFQKTLMAQVDLMPMEIIVDLARVDVVNSLAISVLMRAHGEMEERRRRLHVVNVTPEVREIMELIEVDELLGVQP